MNKTQLDYARGRADAALVRKLEAITKENTTAAVVLSNEERAGALAFGRFKVRPVSEWNYTRNPYLRDTIEFLDESPEVKDQKAIDAQSAAVRAAHAKLLDELILGDVEHALALIRAFEAE